MCQFKHLIYFLCTTVNKIGALEMQISAFCLYLQLHSIQTVLDLGLYLAFMQLRQLFIYHSWHHKSASYVSRWQVYGWLCEVIVTTTYLQIKKKTKQKKLKRQDQKRKQGRARSAVWKYKSVAFNEHNSNKEQQTRRSETLSSINWNN